MGIAPQEEMALPPLSAFDGRPHSFFLARWLPMPIIRAHFAPGNWATRTRGRGPIDSLPDGLTDGAFNESRRSNNHQSPTNLGQVGGRTDRPFSMTQERNGRNE